MNKYLQELINLNNYDLSLDKLVPQEESIKRPLTSIQNKKLNLDTQLTKINDEIKNTLLKKSKTDLNISDLKDKLKEIDVKLAKVKTEKELKALSLEQELAKEQIDGANEDIERLDKLQIQKKEESENIQTEIDKLNQEVALIEVEITEKLESLENQKRNIYENREKLISEMTPNIYRHYQKIKRWAGNTAVSPIKKQACMGCHMKINDKIYAEAIKAEEIISCPHCGRVLYVEPESE
jgi:predicted  nucleic acid-binding Zn-ribbon protein